MGFGLLSAFIQGAQAVPPVSSAGAVTRGTGGIPGYEVIALGRGHMNRLCLAATVEGVKGLMMLDTGASHSGLSTGKYAFLLKTETHPLPSGVPRTAKVNGTPTRIAFAKDFHVGKVDLGSLPLAMLPPRYLYETHVDDRQYDGLLGEDLLRRFRAVVDCGHLAAYFNTDPARKINLGPGLLRAGWTRVPMSNLENDFVVPCEINGQTYRMIVDTGAPFVIMDRGMLQAAHVAVKDIPMHGGVIGTRGAQAGFVRLDSVAFGNYHVSHIQVVADPQSASYFQDHANDQTSGKVLGLLGGSFLADHHAFVDIAGSALYLKSDGARP